MTKGLFIGLAGIDIIYYSEEYPDRNDKVAIPDYRTFTGGPAANEAITFSMLGGESTLITSIGRSALGKAIYADLDFYGVKVKDLSKNTDILPFVSAILVDGAGERSIWSGQRTFSQIDWVPKMDDYDFCMCDCYMAPHSLEILRKCHGKMPICLDVDAFSETVYDYLALADIAILSAKVWVSIDFKRLDPRLTIIITDNGFPIKVIDGEEEYEVPVRKANVIDTLGAGDIFHGAFAHYYYDKLLSIREATKGAADIATLSVEYLGTREWKAHL